MSRAHVTDAMLKRWLGENCYRLRKAAKLTQMQVAELADLDLRFYQKCEYGEVTASLTTIAKLAQGLDVEPIVLISKPPKPKG